MNSNIRQTKPTFYLRKKNSIVINELIFSDNFKLNIITLKVILIRKLFP